MRKVVLTEQREIFAREVVRVGVASRAYLLAYKCKPDIRPNTVAKEASKLLAIPAVIRRIEQLRAQAAAKCGVTVETQIVKLEQHREGAMEDGAWGAANQAVMGQARVAGLLKDADDSGSNLKVTITINSTDAGLA